MCKISLVFPVYNVSSFVENSFLSALAQTYKDVEFIIIDDCSTDDSMSKVYKILDHHVRKKDVFVYKHNKNMGLSEARNTGLRMATGKYIYFMDSDDLIVPECLQLHYDSIVTNQSDFTIAGVKKIGGHSVNSNMKFTSLSGNDILKSYLQREWMTSAWNKLIVKDFLLENELFFKKGLIYEDMLWLFEVVLNANRMSVVPQQTYLYIIRNNSITTTLNSTKKIDSWIYIIESLFSYYKEVEHRGLSKSFRAYFSFLKFKGSLLLINADCDISFKRKAYNEITKKKIIDAIRTFSPYEMILSMPFFFFCFFFKIPYTIYKIIGAVK